ncbi:MAG: redox-sensing transcriptional repressor Rex [Spirochaetales bacterium]|nr:MAG: redox-sensing transcriptional repressor Rex [Spirochaetales bacterium]
MKQKDFMLRLMKYKRVLMQLRTMGLGRIFSNNLGDALGVSASLVRKDLASIDMQGNRRGGYNIDTMLELINEKLGSNDAQQTILIGCGNLGKALLNHKEFNQEGISIAAGFDIAPSDNNVGGIPILPMESLESYIQDNNVKAALLTVPAASAAELKDRLLSAGIQGILNFASVELKSQDNCIIQNVNIGLEIENLLFRVNALKKNKQAGINTLHCPDEDTCEG